MRKTKKRGEGQKRRSPYSTKKLRFRLHPLFLLVGVWYALKGELFLFFLSTLVAVQHECAHAFAAARLGYKLHSIVLMPFGAVIDGDLRGISLKDEIFVAVCGPLCNLVTGIFFVALWWFFPTLYAFTDVAFYSSLAIALVNALPLYPLDGGRVLKCSLMRLFNKTADSLSAEKRADKLCRACTLLAAGVFLLVFLLLCLQGTHNLTLFAFGCFLLVGGIGNRDGSGVYERVDFTLSPALNKGVEIRRVAISEDCPIKDGLRFITRGSYLVLEVHGEGDEITELPQNLLSELFLRAETPYESLKTALNRYKMDKKE